ncbi:MAG: carbon storage regulator [Proteobacteria bacterium]|nr:carbon storage regulator [Pseudomonadota bacterium]
MLVLTRRQAQSLRIGQDVVVTILAVRDRSIRIGIEAPKHVRVLREEVGGSARESAGASESLRPPEPSD